LLSTACSLIWERLMFFTGIDFLRYRSYSLFRMKMIAF